MDRLVLNTLDDKENTHTFPFLRSAAMQVNECSVTFRSLFSSPCCPLHHTGQDYLPLGRLDSGEESQRSSSTRPLCSCRGGNKRNNTHIIHTCNIVSSLQMTNIQGKNFFTTRTDLVNSRKERKDTMAPIRWHGGVKDVSSRTSLTLATCTMP